MSQQKRIAILQSAYIPWKGFFDIIGSVDVFVVYDDVQYSKNHWHNRNIIKTKDGPNWLTIPVSTGPSAYSSIDRVNVAGSFAKKHLRSIEQSYAKAPFIEMYRDWLRNLYLSIDGETSLTKVNVYFLTEICRILNIETEFLLARDLGIGGGKTERLINICASLGGDIYLSGPSAKSYLEIELFSQANISLEWMNYDDYPVYDQLHGEFISTVSIIDLILNVGPDARSKMKAPLLR